MTYTIAIVVAWNGERGVAYDSYENNIHFTVNHVHPDDVLALDIGSKIVYCNNMSIELVTSSFVRFSEEVEVA